MRKIRNRLALGLAASALGASLLIPAVASADAFNTSVQIAAASNASVGSAFVDQDAIVVQDVDQDIVCLIFSC